MSVNERGRAAELATLLERQLSLYESVRDLSRRQKEVIGEGNSALLLRLLAEKQDIITMIDELSRRAKPLREWWEERRDSLPVECRNRLEPIGEKLRGILGEIVQLEDEGQSALASAKDETGGKVAKMQMGKAMHKAYGGGKRPPPNARFKDSNG